MILSKERLLKEKKDSGYRQEIIEKVVWLIELLNAVADDSYLATRLVLKDRLLPVLHQQSLVRTLPQLKQWATTMVAELQQGLSSILPLKSNEVEFIQSIRIENMILPELITDSKDLAEKIKLHPAIHWAMR